MLDLITLQQTWSSSTESKTSMTSRTSRRHSTPLVLTFSDSKFFASMFFKTWMVLISVARESYAHARVTSAVAVSSTFAFSTLSDAVDAFSTDSDTSSQVRSRFSRLSRCFGWAFDLEIGDRFRKWSDNSFVVTPVRDGSVRDWDSRRQTINISESSDSTNSLLLSRLDFSGPWVEIFWEARFLSFQYFCQSSFPFQIPLRALRRYSIGSKKGLDRSLQIFPIRETNLSMSPLLGSTASAGTFLFKFKLKI